MAPKLLVTLPFLFWSCASIAAQWELIARTEKVSYFLDRSSVVSAGKLKRAWILENGHDGQNLYAYSSRMQLGVFDCPAKSMAIKRYLLYILPDAKGNPVGEGGRKDSELELVQVVPDSIGELLLGAACK